MQTAIEETYEEVENLVHHLSHRFMRTRGIDEYDYEEWHGEACQAFVTAYDSFDPDLARFTTHLWRGIWCSLATKLRKDAPHWKTLHCDWNGFDDLIEESGYCIHLNVDRFLSDLSDDAQTVVRLVLGVGGHIDDKESDPGEIRLGIYSMLSNFGWSFRRIVETFHEVKTALLE